jgi:hypothetical protein
VLAPIALWRSLLYQTLVEPVIYDRVEVRDIKPMSSLVKFVQPINIPGSSPTVWFRSLEIHVDISECEELEALLLLGNMYMILLDATKLRELDFYEFFTTDTTFAILRQPCTSTLKMLKCCSAVSLSHGYMATSAKLDSCKIFGT